MLPGIYDTFQYWGEQTVWIYSDPHFGDRELRDGIPDRPDDQEQIRRINAKVGKKDTLIILGDVGDLDCVRQLRAGRKILIMGNHDAGATNYKRKTVKRDNIYSDNKLFDEVYEGPLIIGEKLILSHEPVDVFWAYNIHGHIHEGKIWTNHLNVCADVINYEPVNLNQLLKNGLTSGVQTIHRDTIDKAIQRKIKTH